MIGPSFCSPSRERLPLVNDRSKRIEMKVRLGVVAAATLPNSLPVSLVAVLTPRRVGLHGAPTLPSPVLNHAIVPVGAVALLVDVDPALGHNSDLHCHVRVNGDAGRKVLCGSRADRRQDRRHRVRGRVETVGDCRGAVGVPWPEADVSQKPLDGGASVVTDLGGANVGEKRVKGRARRVGPRGTPSARLCPLCIHEPNLASRSEVPRRALLVAGEGGHADFITRVLERLWVGGPRAFRKRARAVEVPAESAKYRCHAGRDKCDVERAHRPLWLMSVRRASRAQASP